MAELTPSLTPPAPADLVLLLREQAVRLTDKPAFIFCPEGDEEQDRITYAELDRRARAIAADLQRRGAAGERVLVLCRPGVDSVAGLFGCFYAGAVAVPVDEKWPIKRVETIVPEVDARFALATAKTSEKMKSTVSDLGGRSDMTWLPMDIVPGDGSDWVVPDVDANTIAMIQYTSGSTGVPKGCVLTHGNYLHNLEILRRTWDARVGERMYSSPIAGVSWLPQYHDMGFVGGILGTLRVGITTVLMSPAAFMMRPIRWLQAMSRFRAVITAGPNFGYEACIKRSTPEQRAELDLSNWAIGVLGAEPVRPATLESFTEAFAPSGFRAETLMPCYGFAEATLCVTGESYSPVPIIRQFDRAASTEGRVVDAADVDGDAAIAMVACGRRQGGQDVLIVDPETRLRRGPDEIGEIWVAGPSVGVGYWNRPDETEHIFGARLADTGEGPYLRSGDMGFFRDDELYVTGRCKDLMSIGGYNHYPNDIEMTVQACHPALMDGRGAAFLLPADRGAPEYMVVVQEVHHHEAAETDLDELIASIREQIRTHHGIDAQAVVLLKPMRIPTTTSGKIQRAACRDKYVAGELTVLAEWAEPKPESNGPNGLQRAVMAGLGRLVAGHLGREIPGGAGQS